MRSLRRKRGWQRWSGNKKYSLHCVLLGIHFTSLPCLLLLQNGGDSSAKCCMNISNTNSVYRNIYSSSCCRSLLLFSGSHLFSLDAVHTITILIMKIIAACITVLLFDNIFHVQEGLLKLSSLTSHTVQASYSHRAILTANLIVELLKIPAYVHRPGCHCTRHITRDQPFSEEFLI